MIPALPFAPDRGLSLDLHLPDGPPRGVILALHGGGFLRGARAEPWAQRLATLATARGHALADADYRLRATAADFPPAEAQAIAAAVARGRAVGLRLNPRLCGPALFAAMEDAGAALAALRSGALHPATAGLPVTICGISAGGIAALALAFPPAPWAARLPRPDAVLAVTAAVAMPWRLGAGGPPSTLLHGSVDRIVPLADARLAARRARAAGANLQLIETGIPGHVPQVEALLTGRDPAGRPYLDRLFDADPPAEAP
ncbi:MAG TPA: hypothetical protein VLA78_10325 [Paracoccaceae bacterium]|nr:hypothetical protein [Paracoccaceae bacterium]